MSKSLTISLIIFSIIWFIFIFRSIRKDRISVRYAMPWLFASLIILLVGLMPKFMGWVTKKVGFITTANLVIAILLTLLLIITLILTMIITNQKTQINNLIQEVSILKKDRK